MKTLERRLVPAVTTTQMREVDRVMVEELHIELVQMMENAGRALAELAMDLFHPDTVTVLAGPGGNGGGGLVAARHLANRGVGVSVTLSHPTAALAPVTRHQLDILRRMRVPIASDPRPSALLLDALIGYSLRGDPVGRTAVLIEWAIAEGIPIVALDTPSGLDVTSGRTGSPCIGATVTLTLGLPKVGLLEAAETGELFLADISIPPDVYAKVGLTVPPLFGEGTVVQLVPAASPRGRATMLRGDRTDAWTIGDERRKGHGHG